MTWVQYDYPYGPLPAPCGIVGPGPDNDYNVTGYGGGLLLRFVDKPYNELVQNNLSPHLNSYLLDGIIVVAKPLGAVTPQDTACP